VSITYLIAKSLIFLDDLVSTVEDDVQMSGFGRWQFVAANVLYQDGQFLLSAGLIVRLDQRSILRGNFYVAAIHVTEVGNKYVLAGTEEI
jgi:hypothetical protein